MAGSPARRLAALSCLLVALGPACRTATPPEPAALRALTADLGQLLLVGFAGTEADAELERLLCATRVGGVIIFARNIADADQLGRLTTWMQARARACTGQPLLIAVDAEGGRVMRLTPGLGWTGTLSAEDLGWTNDFTLTELEGLRIGRMLRAAGINWNLAPVVDLGLNPANAVVVGAGRSFGANPTLVTAHARAFVRGLRSAGVITTLKHFPGHGSSLADSHVGFVDVTDTARLDVELLPYRALIAEDLVDTVMTAHVFNRRLDPRHPATLSYPTISGLLKSAMGFDGVVVTDDLRMAAIEERYGTGEAVVLALSAGVDMLLIADDRLPAGYSAAAGVLVALRRALAAGELDPARVEAALERVSDLKARLEE